MAFARLVFLVGCAALVACGQSAGAGFAGDAGSPIDSSRDSGRDSATSDGPSLHLESGPPSDSSPPPSSDCPDEAKLIYVVSDDTNALYSFNPPTLTFTEVGVLACESTSSPFAMSVARDGTAWVLYSDGNLFHVSTKDASCSPTAYVPGQNGFTTFGMGFSANSKGSTEESLFACWTEGLARIDTTSLVLTPVGTMPGLDVSSGCDLTGTGGGALYSFITQPTQWVVAQLDKTTSGPMWQHPVTPPIPAGGAWGTSFWGGDLYLYTAPSSHSIVWRYDPTTNTTDELVSDVGFTIVGAGESTCVPTTPPPPQ